MTHFDFTLIGGGIVGVSTALALKKRYPSAAVVLIEKERCFAAHQTGHNSGVIHAGVYYEPGSLKARFCKQGADLTLAFCKEHNLPYRQCGKLLVATDPLELDRMNALEQRCELNQIATQRIRENELYRMEPNIRGLGALWVPGTAITDYTRITRKMADLFLSSRGVIKMGKPVTAIRENPDDIIIYLGSEQIRTKILIACGGMQADRLAAMMNIPIDFSIIPFRGEYYQLPTALKNIVSHLIYPIPDPDLPFLGVHLTPMVDGCVTVGPNAVLGWKREGYHPRFNINLKDMLDMVCFPGFPHLILGNLLSGIKETIDSHYKPGYLKRIHKYCPDLKLNDLKPYPAGIRAQAVKKDGTLAHDFLFARSPRSLHVCNAPSPAATSAIPISEYLCDKVEEDFNGMV